MCTSCDPGYYCDGEGMIGPRGQCDAGYLCYGNASKSNPTDGVTGEECPAGGYCLQGKWNLILYSNNILLIIIILFIHAQACLIHTHFFTAGFIL